MGLYTHEIRSEDEPLWIHEFAPALDINGHDSVDTAAWMNGLIDRLGAANDINKVTPKFVTKAFIYEEDWEIFEFSCMMRGYQVTRLE